MTELKPSRWWMAAKYGRSMAMPEMVAASDLDQAFRIIRTLHPTANEWRCLGKVPPGSPSSLECTEEDRGVTEIVVRKKIRTKGS